MSKSFEKLTDHHSFGFLKQTEESDVIASAVATAEQLGTAVVCVGHGNVSFNQAIEVDRAGL